MTWSALARPTKSPLAITERITYTPTNSNVYRWDPSGTHLEACVQTQLHSYRCEKMDKDTSEQANSDAGPSKGEFGRKEKIISLFSGLMLALSLVVVDWLMLSFGTRNTLLFGFMLPVNVVMSGLFITSLAGGILVGKAYLSNSALTVVAYGGAWFFSVFGAYVIATPYECWQMLAAPVSLFVGGLSLGLYRTLQGEKAIDDLLMRVMLASTALNLLYFILGLGVSA